MYPTILQEQRLWVMEVGVITLSDIWWYCWQNWVGFLCLTSTGNSFHIQDIPASVLTLQPHSRCSFSTSELKTRNHGGRSEIWIMESSSEWLRSELSWSLGLSWVSSNCNVEILLEFLVVSFLTPSLSLCQLLKFWQSFWLPCNGLFSCWVEQYYCHMLKATIGHGRCMSKAAAISFSYWQMLLKSFTSSCWCSSLCRFEAFLWPNSATQ